jgi:hypothetical protein
MLAFLIKWRWLTAGGCVLLALGLWARWDFAVLQQRHADARGALPADLPYREVLDLHAQQSMAEFAYGVLLFSAFGFVVSIVGAAALFLTLRQNRHMIEATREIGQNETRAYVLVNQAGAVTNLTEGMHGIILNVRNVGATPATDIVVTARLSPASYSTERVEPLKLMDFRFPLVTDAHSVRLFVEKSELQPWLDKVQKGAPEGRLGSIRLSGEVQYTDVFGARRFTGYYALIHEDAWKGSRSEIRVHPGVGGAFHTVA